MRQNEWDLEWPSQERVLLLALHCQVLTKPRKQKSLANHLILGV